MGLYAAYASNLDPAQMARRAPHSPLRGTGWLRGWRLTFGGEDRGWEGALPTVVPEAPLDPDTAAEHQAAVFVTLHDVTEEDEVSLDDWEGVGIGLYRKVRVRVDTDDGPQVAWVYTLDTYEGGMPSARFVGLLAEAAEAGGAPADYVAALRALPCRSVG